MKRTILASAVAATMLATGAQAATEVNISGFSGDNIVIMNTLLNEVLADELKALDIKVKYNPVDGDYNQFLTNALSAGTAPDLFYIDIFTINPMSQTNRVAALPESLNSTTEDILPNLNKSFTVDGKQYGIAKDFNTLAVQYNKDIFDDAGVDYPTADDTWTTLRDKLAAVKTELGDVDGMCVVPDYARFAAFALSTGWQPFDAQGRTILDDNFKRAFEFYTSLPESGAGVLAADLGQGWTGGCFGTEATAISLEGSWMGGYLRDQAPSMQYGTVPTPKDPKTGDRGNLIFTVSWSMNADAANADATAKVMELLTSEEAQQWVLEQGLALPSRAALAENAYFKEQTKEAELSRVVFEGASDGNVLPYEFQEHGGKWLEIANEALNSVLLKQSDVDTALASAQAKFDKLTGHL